MTPEELVGSMHTSLEQGLSSREAAARLSKFGKNSLKAPEKRGLWMLIAEQFEDKMVQILLGVATLSAVLAATDVQSPKDIIHAFTEPFIILLILAINAGVGVTQAQNAEASLEALKRMQSDSACVLREGVWDGESPSDGLVPGDVLYLRVGDRVPADCRVVKLKTMSFSVDESSLTGESVTVQKSPEALPHARLIPDKTNMLFSGTIVTKGGCYAVVTGTGQNTEMGAINQGVQQAAQERSHVKTPLTQKLDAFSDQLTKVIGVVCVVVFLISIPRFDSPAFASKTQGAIYYAKTAVALGVAAIPEGLPAVITMCLSLGTTRMAKRNVIVRKLPSVETLGCTSVICTDKTGTLTTNQMTVTKMVTLSESEHVKAATAAAAAAKHENKYKYDDYDNDSDIFFDEYSDEDDVGVDDFAMHDDLSTSAPPPRLLESTVEGVGYDPAGRVVLGGDSATGASAGAREGGGEGEQHMANPNLQDLAAIASLCNEASIEYKEGDANDATAAAGSFCRIGEPTEAALKVLVEKLGVVGVSRTADKATTARQYSDYWASRYDKLCILEFNRDRKSMGVLVRPRKSKNSSSGSKASSAARGGMGDNNSNRHTHHPTTPQANRLFVKGAAELVVQRCNRVKLDSGRVVKMTHELRERVLAQVRGMQCEPLRCLALAYKDGHELPGDMGTVSSQSEAEALPELRPVSKGGMEYADIETDMVLTGVTGIRDPARPEVREAISKCTAAGIRVMMITGDSKDTAVAIARDTSIFGKYEDEHLAESVFTGEEFFSRPPSVQRDLLKHGNKVFCRTEPKDKQVLVSMLDSIGEVAAMTGDGVNDAPALQQASIGIAMGIAGTEVAKDAADMVLADDNFATIVAAVEEGRNIFDNMSSFVCFLLSCNMGEIATVVLGTLLGLPEALSPLHLLWVNLVTDGPPATALGFSKADPKAMTRRPRSKDEHIMTPWMFARYAVTGTYVGLATIGSFLWWYRDKHVSLKQLGQWTSCTSWPDFTHSAEAPNLPLDPCEIFSSGRHKHRAQAVALSTLVSMEMLKALSAVSLTQSIFRSPPWSNPTLILGVTVPFLLHLCILYIPPLAKAFGLAPLNKLEWTVVAKFALPILLVEEALKFISRHRADIEDMRRRRPRLIPAPHF
jgi:magnesium-transporting ATPase (P-type)